MCANIVNIPISSCIETLTQCVNVNTIRKLSKYIANVSKARRERLQLRSSETLWCSYYIPFLLYYLVIDTINSKLELHLFTVTTNELNLQK